jgi:integrase/recombinase XerD
MKRPKPTPKTRWHNSFSTSSTSGDALAFEFFLKTGGREQEVARLEWGELKLDGKTEVTLKTKESHRIKNGKTRKVPLERGLAKKLIACRKKNPASVLVFPSESGKVEGHFLRVMYEIVERAKLNPARFWLHKFRDTFATWSLRAGRDIRTVQHWLGHASIEETQKCLAPEQDDVAQASTFSNFKIADTTVAAAV